MKRLIIVGICILALSMVAAKTYKKKTKDGEVYTKAEVQVEMTDTSPKLTTYTLNNLYTRRQVKITQIANDQAELITLNALIVLVEAEANKAILKIPEE